MICTFCNEVGGSSELIRKGGGGVKWYIVTFLYFIGGRKKFVAVNI